MKLSFNILSIQNQNVINFKNKNSCYLGHGSRRKTFTFLPGDE
jgi:hypothetical protein